MGALSNVVLRSVCALMLLDRACQAVRKTTVQITSNLPGGTELTVHCKSKDDDFGDKVLAPNLSWSFQFRPLVLVGETLYFCSFSWSDQFHYFNIYEENRDLNRCDTNCLWSILPNGPCAFEDKTGQYSLCLPWNKD